MMITLDDDQPWLKAPDESDKAYAAFEKYMILPIQTRSLLAAWLSTQEGGQKGGERGVKKAPSRWQKWSSDYQWVERVAAWEAHQSALLRRQFEAQAADDKLERIRTLKIARGMLWRSMKLLDDYLKEETSTIRFLDVFYAIKIVNSEARNEFDDNPAQRHRFSEAELDAEINRKLAILANRRQSEVLPQWPFEDDPYMEENDE